MTVLIPRSDQPEILSYREDLQKNFVPGKHEQRTYESCHVWHNKNGRIQGADNQLSQIFRDFYTYLLSQLCKMPKSFNGQRYRCGTYRAFEDHLLVHLCCKQMSQTHPGSIFTFSDSLPTVKSNTVFG